MRERQDRRTKPNVWVQLLTQTLFGMKQVGTLLVSIIQAEPVYSSGARPGLRSRTTNNK